MANGFFNSFQHNADTCFQVCILGVKELLYFGNRTQQRHAAACNRAFFHSRLGCRKCVLNAQFLFFHFGLGCRAYADNRHAACEFCKSFLQFFAVKVRGCGFDLALNLCYAAFDGVAVACTVHNGGVLFGNLNLLCAAELGQVCVFQFQTKVGSDDFAACENGDVLQHFFSSVTEAGRLYANTGKRAAQFIDENGGKRFAFDILRDDDQLLTCVDDFLKQGQDFLNVGNLLIGNQNECVVDYGFHFVGVGYHIGGDVPAVELHTLYNITVGFAGFGFFNGNNTVCGDLFHRVRNQLADEFICGGNGRDTCDVVTGLDRLCFCLECGNDCVNRHLHTFFDNHRVCACRNILHTLADECLRKQGCGGSAVACDVIGLGCDLFDKLCAHIFECIFQLDFFCDGYTVVGNQRCAVFFVENHISAFRAECDFNGVAQFVNTGLQCLARFFAVNNLFCHNK